MKVYDALIRDGATKRAAADALEQQQAEIARSNQSEKEAWWWAKECEEDMHRLAAEIKRLKAENAELRKDAERYRWLRKGGNLWGICIWEDDEWAQDARTNVDSLIDAAMEGKK